MNVSITVSTPPVVEPVTVSEVESSLALSAGFDSTRLTRLIKAARLEVERDTERSLIKQTLKMKLDRWPRNKIIYLPKPPAISLVSLKYINTSGVETSLTKDDDFYFLSTGDNVRIEPKESWPSLTDRKEAVEVIWEAGYGTSAEDVPTSLGEAVIAKVDMLYSKGELDTSEYYDCIVKGHKHFFDWTIND